MAQPPMLNNFPRYLLEAGHWKVETSSFQRLVRNISSNRLGEMKVPRCPMVSIPLH
jgi:hypothetical protein